MRGGGGVSTLVDGVWTWGGGGVKVYTDVINGRTDIKIIVALVFIKLVVVDVVCIVVVRKVKV